MLQQQLRTRNRISTQAEEPSHIIVIFDKGVVEDNNTVVQAVLNHISKVVFCPRYTRIAKIFLENPIRVQAFGSQESTTNKNIIMDDEDAQPSLRKAFLCAQQMFSKCPYGEQRLMFVITDTRSSTPPCADAARIAQSLSEESVTIIGVDLGRSPRRPSMYDLGDWYDAQQFSAIFKPHDQSPADSIQLKSFEVTTKWFLRKPMLKLGESLPLSLQVCNVGRSSISDLGISIYGKPYFVSPWSLRCAALLPCGETVRIEFDVPVDQATLETLPSSISFRFVAAQGAAVHCEQKAVVLSSEIFVGSLVECADNLFEDGQADSINCLLFGVVGSGKSSFVNTVLTCISNKVQTFAAVGGSDDHVTTEYSAIRIQNLRNGIAPIPLRLFDTWGLDNTNYKQDEIKLFLEGSVPLGFRMTEKLSNVNKKGAASRDPGANRIHVVVCCVPTAIVNDPETQQRVKQNIEVIKRFHRALQTVVLITMGDRVDPETHPQIKQQVATTLKIPAYNVYVIQNYEKQARKSFAIDKSTLAVLDCIMSLGGQFILETKPGMTRVNICDADNQDKLIAVVKDLPHSYDVCLNHIRSNLVNKQDLDIVNGMLLQDLVQNGFCFLGSDGAALYADHTDQERLIKEGHAKVKSCSVDGASGSTIRVQRLPTERISVLCISGCCSTKAKHRSIGTLRFLSARMDLALSKVRAMIDEQLGAALAPAGGNTRYQFLNSDGDVLTTKQEERYLLEDCLRTHPSDYSKGRCIIINIPNQ